MSTVGKRGRWSRFKDWWRWSWLGQRWKQFGDWAWRRRTTVRPRWLGHGYCDPDHLLTYMVFEILGRFLEDPREAAIVDWEASGPDHAAAKRELDEHWQWWREVYLKESEQAFGDEAVPGPKFVYTTKTVAGQECHVSEMVFPSPEAEQRWRSWIAAERQREVDRGAELKRRMKRIIDLKDFLWS